MKILMRVVFCLALATFTVPAHAERETRENIDDERQVIAAVCRIPDPEGTGAVRWRELTAAEFAVQGCPEGSKVFVEFDLYIPAVSGEPVPGSLGEEK